VQELAVGKSQAELTEYFRTLPMEERVALAHEINAARDNMRMVSQLLFYKPVSEKAKQIHYWTKKIGLAVGGNRSSKTDTLLADTVIQMTNIVPASLPDYPKKKLQAPIRARIVCESLTNTWAQVIRPKLQWNQWNGRGARGGPDGHWGWVPRDMLIRGKWDDSWSEKERTLTLLNGSTLQVMSYDQDVQDFSGGSFHVIQCDEGPPADIWRENTMRTIDTDGFLRIGFTPPDEESTSWKAAWIHSEIYEPGIRGNPGIDCVQLYTEDNRILDAASILEVTAGMSEKQKAVRLRGEFMHLSGRIYKYYTDSPQIWCFRCNDTAFVRENQCVVCHGSDLTTFQHLIPSFSEAFRWPIAFMIDPHPRKPHMMSWFAISPSDDIFQVAELEIDGEAEEVKKAVDDMEYALGMEVFMRGMDPNMGESPAAVTNKRGKTVRDEFDAVGLRCKMMDDCRYTAMHSVKTYLKPDPRSREPRFHIFDTCTQTDYQLRNWLWDEHATAQTSAKRDPKGVPQEKNSDFPTLLGYFLNENPTYSGAAVGHRRQKRRGRVGAEAPAYRYKRPEEYRRPV
jgi:phage terminase large subunit-like protein